MMIEGFARVIRPNGERSMGNTDNELFFPISTVVVDPKRVDSKLNLEGVGISAARKMDAVVARAIVVHCRDS